MTMPFERFRSVVWTEEFLKKLLDPQKTPRIPKSIRQEALYCLRHYPTKFEMECIAEKTPEWLDDKFV